MATVYDGWDLKLGRPVAVKVLHPSLASSPEFRERMAFEARSAAALHHPNIVVVHDSGEDARHGGAPYLIMERWPGRLPPRRHRARPALATAGAPRPLGDPGFTAATRRPAPRRQTGQRPLRCGGRGEDRRLRRRQDRAADLTQLGSGRRHDGLPEPQRIAGHAATPMDDLYAAGAVGDARL